MIDAKFIEAKRRAAKDSGEGPGSQRRRRHAHRGGERASQQPVLPPARAPEAVLNENLEFKRDPNPNRALPRMSPQIQPTVPANGSARVPRYDGGGVQPVISQSIPIESLETGVLNLSIREDMPPPKQGKQRGRQRGRSNVSKNSSIQRTFHGRTSFEEQPTMNRLSTGSRKDLTTTRGPNNATAKGASPISAPSSSPIQANVAPVVRLPDVTAPPISNDSRDSVNLIHSEDTDFGSDISRGAVKEGRLYNYREPEKHKFAKPREPSRPEPRLQEEKTEQPQRGVLRIQTGTTQGKTDSSKQPSGHRGGLLRIDSNALRSGAPPKNKHRGGQQSEFNRKGVLLRRDQESQNRSVWNPEDDDSPPEMLHEGRQYVLSAEDILAEIKSAYQEIQALERKIKATYESQNDGLEIARIQRRPSTDSTSWSAYAKFHTELLGFYHTFFIMTQHPSASASVRRLPKRHNILARYWKYGIVQYLEYLRSKLPLSQVHMKSFIFEAYTLTSVLLQDVSVFQAVWMECLGDLARYLYGIEENDEENKEHWREIASEWYLRTVDGGHGIEGRLFHHLGILSKDDRLLQLFYFSKSLAVVKRFSSARESFLIMIDPILGSQSATWLDAFVKLLGMLFARLQLDSFDDQLDAFFNFWGEPFPTYGQWAQLAIINIAALYQFNRKDSRLREALRQGRRERREAEIEDGPVEESADGDMILPPSQSNENLETDMANVARAPDNFANIPTDMRSDDHEDVSLSKIVFDKACSLAFNLLLEVLNTGPDEGPMMFVHVFMVFLVYSLRYSPVVHLLERKVPWQDLVEFLNDFGETPLPMEELSGPVLAEDSFMRGFEWSRKLFPKNWFECVDPVEELESTEKDFDARKHRILSLGLQITKICDCIELVNSESSFRVSERVKVRIAAAEAREAEEAARLEEAAQAAREAAKNEFLSEEAQVPVESDEDADIPGESDEIRTLKARRRELKALLKARRTDSHNVPVSKQPKKEKAKAIKREYTILVFDTNLLVSHLELLKQAITTGEWRIVVPLIVINELDGLKVNPPPLGPAAAEAVAYVEQALLSRKLRVVTQQGNGLSNLALRSQQLLPKGTEDGVGSIDAFIIQTVKEQAERHMGKSPAAEKAVLVTGDRNMRVIAKAKGVQALTAADLKKEIFKTGKHSQEQPKRKAWG